AGRGGLLVPAVPLPWAALGTLDANLSLAATQVVWRGVPYRDFEAHLALAGGRLTLAPLALRVPGGLVQGTVSADAGGAVSLALRAPGLALAPLLAAYHLPAQASGTLEAFLTMAGRGPTAQAVVAGLNGSAGAAMVNGTIDGKLVGQLLGQGLRTAGLPPLLAGRQGAERVRCLAVRLDAHDGAGRFPALLLKSSRSYLDGGGSTNFGTETLALDLAPRVETAGQTAIVPVHVGGTWAAPKLTVKPGAALAAGARVLGGITGGKGFLGQLGQVLAPAQASALPPEQACAPALAAARGGLPGPMPPPRPAATPAAPASPAAPGLPQPLLRLLP
ncbi:MAG: AsmA family protein, partial [Acetobacteraceae bacterium]